MKNISKILVSSLIFLSIGSAFSHEKFPDDQKLQDREEMIALKASAKAKRAELKEIRKKIKAKKLEHKKRRQERRKDRQVRRAVRKAN